MTAVAAWTVRPLTDPDRIPAGDDPAPFGAPWSDTVELLIRELSYLRATHVLLELELPAAGLAPVPGPLSAALGATEATGPRVRLSFDSRHGPLSYATGRFAAPTPGISWRSNVRAVALGLQSLRRVDRYGIATGGQQYSGWLTLPAGEPAASAAVRVERSGATAVTPTQVIADVGTFRHLYQAAARRYDPDAGGDVAAWSRLQRARAVLSDHHHGAF